LLLLWTKALALSVMDLYQKLLTNCRLQNLRSVQHRRRRSSHRLSTKR